MTHQIVWVDIPARQLDRAIRFYTAVLGAAVEKQQYSTFSIGLLPHTEGSITGCLSQSAADLPGQSGPLIYLNCSGRLDDAIAAVEANGGQVLKPKHQIGPYGWRAVILDSEGNRVALHSQ